ncbi:MAG: hypothetical protein AAFS10_22315 [Myxococcota bacterium]
MERGKSIHDKAKRLQAKAEKLVDQAEELANKAEQVQEALEDPEAVATGVLLWAVDKEVDRALRQVEGMVLPKQ